MPLPAKHGLDLHVALLQQHGSSELLPRHPLTTSRRPKKKKKKISSFLHLPVVKQVNHNEAVGK